MKNLKYLLLTTLLLWMPVFQALAEVPLMMNYQGAVNDATGSPVNGNGFFKFAIVDQAGTTAYWANDGTTVDGTEPRSSVTVVVTDGKFAVKLGDPDVTNMSSLPTSVFDNAQLFLRVWFSVDNSNFEQFNNDIQIVSTGFAFKAANADRAAIADEVANIDPAQIQSRVTGACLNGDTISAINENGSVECQPDDGAVYTAGAGINITANQISISSVSNAQIADLAWSKLTGVPAGFADGVDNDTTYTGGTGISIAGSTISISSAGVGSEQIADDSIAAVDIGAGAVGSSEILNNSITASDIGANAVGSSELAANSVGGAHLAPGFVSIPPSAFVNQKVGAAGCERWISSTQFYWSSTSTDLSCLAYAPVTLPHGASIDGISCYITDSYFNAANVGSVASSVFFYGRPLLSGTGVALHVGSTATGVTTRQTITNTLSATIDNSAFAYSLYLSLGNTNIAGTGKILHGCTISYS